MEKVGRTLTDWCHLSFFHLNCDMASQRTIGDEGFSMGAAHMTADANHLQQIREKGKNQV